MTPKITIIIPMYKVEKYLPRCLDSVLNQTFQDWQAVCVDDGTPDKSGWIAEKYAKRDSRFVVVHKKNGGLSSARNAGLKVAKGKYIMFLDSDDCIHPQTMEILYTLAERENVDIVSFDYDRESHNAKDAVDFPADKMPEFFQNKYQIDKIKYRYVKNLITKSTNDDFGSKSWYIQTCMVCMRMYRLEFLKGLRFDESVSVLEDVMFWSMVLLRQPSGIITRLPLYYYTVNSGSILHSNHGIKGFFDIVDGLHKVAKEFNLHADKKDMKIWYKRFFWSMLPRMFHSAMREQDMENKRQIAKLFNDMQNDGVFEIAPDFHAKRYRRRILKFISQNL